MAAGILQLPCLGRTFHLGMLYDSRSEKIIPGITLWDADKLKSALQSKPQTSSKFEVVAEGNIRKKFSSFAIDSRLKLSILGGLITMSGAAEYIEDRKSSKQQARVTLKYSSTSRFDELVMEQIKGIQYPDVLEDTDATHVVTGVVYGSDAFFVFDRTVTSEEKHCDVYDNMEALVKAIPSLNSDSVSVPSKRTQKDELEKLSCTFYGDLVLESNPSSYAEAIKVYGELPVMKTDSIPKVVHLYPLSKLDGRQQKVICSINNGLISKVEEVMEYIHDLEIKCKDLKKCDECFKFCDIDSQISTFLSLLKEFKMDFVKKLSELLPKIRGSRAEEKDLADLVSSIYKSPFNSKEMTSYVKRKDKELNLLSQCLKMMSTEPKVQHFFPSETFVLYSMTTDQYEHIICFAFNVTSEETGFTRNLESYLSTGETEDGCVKEWFEKQQTLKSLRNKSKRFQEFVKTNTKKEGLAFAVTDKNEEIDSSGPAIILYSNGEPMDFDPPGKPGTPKAKTISVDFIDLVWSAPDEGASSIQSYNVLYGPNGVSVSWSEKSTVSKEEKIHIECLIPDMEYCFKVEAVSLPGVSVESNVFKVATHALSRVIHHPVDNLVKQSKRIKEGSPSIYQLPLNCTMEDTENKLYRYQIGSPDLSSRKPERVLMVVGATGAGKSTLINGLANYVLEVKWKDNFRFQVIVGESDRSQACSQTKQITAYTFHSTSLPYVLTIIDTPGFGDTDGIESDKLIAKQIQHFFSKEGMDCVDQLHGIAFVAQASLARLTPTQKYIFDAVLSIFGKDVEDNIFLMATFADADDPPVLGSVKRAGIPYKESFKFNNSAIFARNDTSGDDFKHMFWKMGTMSFAHFFNSFSTSASKSLKMTREVLKEREQVEKLIQDFQKKVRAGMQQVDVIQQEELLLIKYKAEIDANKDFTGTIKRPKHRQIRQYDSYTTNCMICSYTCHHNCVYSEHEDKENCCKMMNGYCTECPRRCHWKNHKNTPFYFEQYYESVAITLGDLKEKYTIAQSDKSNSQSMIANNEAILLQLQAQLFSLLDQTRLSIVHLDEIAMKSNPLSEIEYIGLLIESETREHKIGWDKRVAQYKNLLEQAELFKNIPNISCEDAQVVKTIPWWKKWMYY